MKKIQIISGGWDFFLTHTAVSMSCACIQQAQSGWSAAVCQFVSVWALP